MRETWRVRIVFTFHALREKPGKPPWFTWGMKGQCFKFVQRSTRLFLGKPQVEHLEAQCLRVNTFTLGFFTFPDLAPCGDGPPLGSPWMSYASHSGPMSSRHHGC